MWKTICSVFVIMSLLICSMILTSCDVITAQNISHNGSMPAMNGGGGMNGGPGGNGGGPGMGSGAGKNDNASLTGKIISVDGNSIKIEVAEQTQNNSNKQPQRGFPDNKTELKYTGAQKTLTVNDDVNISQQSGMQRQNKNSNSKSDMKVSDLKTGQVIMIWYKEKTETIERISVVKN